MRSQFWAALIAGAVSALLAVVTLISREWIELVFGVDPDDGDGSMEWAIVIMSALLAVACLSWARIEWRRAHPAAG